MSEVFTTLGDYALVILAIAGVVSLIAKWGIVKPLTTFVDARLASLEEQQDRRWDTANTRLGALEQQMQTNGGRSLRDAVNRIERRQIVDEVVHDQIGAALGELGHPIVIPRAYDGTHASNDRRGDDPR